MGSERRRSQECAARTRLRRFRTSPNGGSTLSRHSSRRMESRFLRCQVFRKPDYIYIANKLFTVSSILAGASRMGGEPDVSRDRVLHAASGHLAAHHQNHGSHTTSRRRQCFRRTRRGSNPWRGTHSSLPSNLVRLLLRRL